MSSYVPSTIIKTLGNKGVYGNEWSYSDFINNLEKHQIDAATIITKDNQVSGLIAIDNNYQENINPENLHALKTTIPSISDNVINKLTDNNINFDIFEIHGLFENVPLPIQLVGIYVVAVIIINVFRNFLTGGSNGNNINPMNPLQMLGSSPEVLDSNKVDTTFNDVAGCEESKYELVEVVDFLKNPKKFSDAGAKIPKGILLEGPPGTGKTLLARAVAGEAGVSFVSASGSQFIEMFVGVGAKRVRELFDTAKKNSPCVIFIDEIDAVGRQRGAGINTGNDEREQTLNQILTNMDGFEKTEGIIVIAATNRADILDSALLRSGRFDRKVKVGLPDVEGRKKIFDVHFKDKKLDESVDFDELSALTSGFSGADIANLANEAAILSVRYNETSINKKCTLDAYEKMTIGIPNMKETREKKILELVAYHETGHALMAKLFDDFFDIRKVTINSNKGGAGGYTLFTPKERYQNYPTKKFMLANLIVALGGRAAEKVLYENNTDKKDMNYLNELLFPNVNDLEITTGASNDLKQAENIARRYVSLFGLGSNIGLYDNSAPNDTPFLGRDLGTNTDRLSDYTKESIDREVQNLITFSYEKAIDIINKNKGSFHKMAELLLEKNTIDSNEINNIDVKFL
jgi:cell division protease FtsH